ncbi:RING finger protein [Seminavis robusta]|uniref:RING finger protein n=1 Tax=Seminavis robusta TaxID=568900 RepID=A0A9N8EEG2_9STRA|nr:RING finger protein [Seminavis robusta]|eukprot:Sro874_g214180.1 RING finger) protein (415) ;mRNA; r:15622-16866
MPRGYLKHCHRAGRKRARGSGSHSVPVSQRQAKIEKGQKQDFPPYIGEQSQIAQDLACGRYDFSLAQAGPLRRLQGITEDDAADWYNEDDEAFYFEEEGGHEEEMNNEESVPANANNVRDASFHATEDEEGSFVAVSDFKRIGGASVLAASSIGSFSICDHFDDESMFSLISESPDYAIVDVEDDENGEGYHGGTSDSSGEGVVETRVSGVAELHQAPSVCFICYEEKPLVKVMKKFRHPFACYDCLRRHYVVNAQQNISNYPLQCFWPDCERILRDAQVQKFVETKEEMLTHYEMEAQAKALRKRLPFFKDVHECPHCSCANLVRPYRGTKRQTIADDTYNIECTQCSRSFTARKLPAEEILSVLAAIGTMFCNCPSCGAFITKDGGCDHMTCIVCDFDFSFQQAAFDKNVYV